MASIPQQPGLISWKQNDKLFWMLLQREMKKSAQRRCKHCALAAVRRSKNFRPATDPLPGGARRPKFISAEDGHYLYLQTQFGKDQCTQFRVIAVTDPQTNTQTDRGDYITLCRS